MTRGPALAGGLSVNCRVLHRALLRRWLPLRIVQAVTGALGMDNFLRVLNSILGILASLIAIVVIAWPNLFPPATRAFESAIDAVLSIQNQTVSWLVIGAVGLVSFILVWTLFTAIARLLRGGIHEYKQDDYWFQSSYRSDVEGSKQQSALGGLSLALLFAVAVGFLAVDPGLSKERFGWQSEPSMVLGVIGCILLAVFIRSILRRN